MILLNDQMMLEGIEIKQIVDEKTEEI